MPLEEEKQRILILEREIKELLHVNELLKAENKVLRKVMEEVVETMNESCKRK